MRTKNGLTLGLWLAGASMLAGCPADDVGSDAPSSGTSGAADTSGTMATTTDASETDAETTEGSSSTGEESPQPAGPDNVIDPAVSGPYPVGVRTIMLSDPSREDGRPLVTEIWYPATEDARDQDTVTYTVADMFRPDAIEIIGDDIASTLPTTAVRDADPRVDDGAYPVVFFSHGSGGIRMQSTYYTVDMASHGYIVVSPDHIGNTLSDIIVDGDLETAALLQSFEDRPKDLDYVRSQLEGDDAPGFLDDMMDFEHVGVTGHSFGALTSVRWMALGADVDAVVAQAIPAKDITLLNVPPLGSFTTPLMLHVGGVDDTTPPADSQGIWEEASKPRAQMILADAGHFTFSDMCKLNAGDIEAVEDLGVGGALDDGCLDTNTDPDVAGAAIRHFGIGFFNVYLRGSTGTLDLLTQEAGQAIAGDILTYEADL